MTIWAKARTPREQQVLCGPSLDELVPDDGTVRLFDEILADIDWSAWECHYSNNPVGQPPLHPRVVAGTLLYAYSQGILSSRKIEAACMNRIDFKWLVCGREIDHSTFCGFRTKFPQELHDLFLQICQTARDLGLIRLHRVGLDGTRVRANNGRRSTNTAKTLEEKLAELDQQIRQIMTEAEEVDRREQGLFDGQSEYRLPKQLADMQRRQERLAKALEQAKLKDAKQQAKAPKKAKGDSAPPPRSVPTTDPDSAMLPNKEGGYSPNYTPMAAVDGEKGYIVDADVHNESTEGHAAVATIERIEKNFQAKPEQYLADGAYGSGQNLQALDEAKVEAFIPVEDDEQTVLQNNPAIRDDPTQPVPAEQREQLPRGKKGNYGRSAFVYDSQQDCFWCPMGRELRFSSAETIERCGGPARIRRYLCVSCADCPASGDCRSGKGPRQVRRDEYEPLRAQMRERMNSPAGQDIYRRRNWICETPFGHIKAVTGLRQFSLRGLPKVLTEWLWSCTGYNLAKLARDMARLRAPKAKAAV